MIFLDRGIGTDAGCVVMCSDEHDDDDDDDVSHGSLVLDWEPVLSTIWTGGFLLSYP